MPPVFLATIALLALFGANSLSDWLEQKAPKLWELWSARAERRFDEKLENEGLRKPDGTLTVDREFDGEVNALQRELDSELKEAGRELDSLEREQ